MSTKVFKTVRVIIWVMLSLWVMPTCRAQLVHYGFKAGANLSWIKHDDHSDPRYSENLRITPKPGFNAGLVASFKMKKKFFLHTELLYTTKGKIVKGKIDKTLKDNVTYNYIEIPITYNIYFDAKINDKRFKGYAGIGPNFSYWLGGHGSIYNDEFAENNFPTLNYKLRFGARGDDYNETNVIYLTNAKRFQLGVNIGGGILVEPNNGHKIMVDARFELGHTWLGNDKSADYIIPVNYKEAKNLKDRNMGVRLSVMYCFERNTDKKVRNKGKSTKKPKRL